MPSKLLPWLFNSPQPMGDVSNSPTGVSPRAFLKRLVLVCAGLFSVCAYAQQDLIVVRSMPTTSGTTASVLTYEISYKNGGAGAANGASIAEQLPNGFQVVGLSCVGAFGGAVCPTTTIVNNDPANFPFPRIQGTIGTFPEFAVVRLRVQMKLSATPGSYNLSGSISGPSQDPIVGTNQVLSSVYVRPLLLDLAVSHSSTMPAIGTSNGGTKDVVLDGDTLASHMPLSVSYRLENLGPDLAPGGAFAWTFGNDGLRAWVSNYWTQATHAEPVGYERSRSVSTDPDTGVSTTRVRYDDAKITLYQCTAIGSAVCPAPTLYRIANGWLARAPQVTARTIIGNDQLPAFRYDDPYLREVSQADYLESQTNLSPHFGQDLAPGAGLILTATLGNPRYGAGTDYIDDAGNQRYRNAFYLHDGIFTQTNQLSTSRCAPDALNNDSTAVASSVSYADPRTGMPLASVSDNDLGNNDFYTALGVARNCPQADILVTAKAAVNGTPGSVVRDGDTYSMTYTVTNSGPANVAGVEIQSYVYANGAVLGTAFFSSNWTGFTSAISCTSSNPAGSPCPSQADLNAWLILQGDTRFASPLSAGSTWTIVISGNAGTTSCAPGADFTRNGWNGNIQAWGVAASDPNPTNNYATDADRQLNFRPQDGCPIQAEQLDISVTKTPLSAISMNDAVEVGEHASFSIQFRNNSTEGIALKDTYFVDYVASRWYQPQGGLANVDMKSFSEFQRQPSQPAGLDISVKTWDEATQMDVTVPPFPSGIVCIAHGAAQCPTALEGTSSSIAAAQAGSYNQFFGRIPLLPSGPNDYIELISPWRALPDQYGCASDGVEGRMNENTMSFSTTATTMAVYPNGAEVLANTLTGTKGKVAFSNVFNKLTPCPTGTVSGNLKKSLNGFGAGTADGVITRYEGEVANGDTLTYQIVLASTGSLGINQYTLQDSKAVPMCRDGIASNPSNVAGQARCGEALLTALTCTPSAGARCPTGAQLAQAISMANSSPSRTIDLSVGEIGDFDMPAIPTGGSVTFTTAYAVTGVNSFTGAFFNNASFAGQSGANTLYEGGDVQLAIPQAPGVSLSKDVDKLQVGEGEMVTYTIDVTNGGNGSLAAGASFEDPLPAGLAGFTGVSCIGLPGPAALPQNGSGNCPTSITNDAGGIRATLPEMPANTMLRFTITALAPAGGVITSVGNAARITIPGTAPVSLLASANFAIPSTRETEIAIPMSGVKSVRNATSGGNSVLPGEQLVYSISYSNVSGMDIANFQISDTLPSQVTYSGGATITTAGPITTGTLNPSFNGGSDSNLLAPGAVLGGAGAITITLPVTVNAGVANGTVIANQGGASGSGVTGSVRTDNVDNSNRACPVASPAPCLAEGVNVPAGSVQQPQMVSIDPTIVGVGAPATNPGTAASVAGFKSVRNGTKGGDSVLPGEQLIYSISYSNSAGSDVANFQIMETLPSNVTYAGGATVIGSGPSSLASINPGFNGSSDSNLLAPGAILGGAEVITVTLPVMVNVGIASGSVIANQASATGTGIPGPVPTDNVDNSNPTCPTTSPSPCLPVGVTVPSSSVPQTQTAALDPVRVPVAGGPTKPSTVTPVPVDSSVMLIIMSLLLSWGVWRSRASKPSMLRS